MTRSALPSPGRGQQTHTKPQSLVILLLPPGVAVKINADTKMSWPEVLP